jgi:hypothetical protein
MKMTICTNQGTVVSEINLDAFDLSKPLAGFAILNEIHDSIAEGKEIEKEEEE